MSGLPARERPGSSCRGLFPASRPCGQRPRDMNALRLFEFDLELGYFASTSHVGVCAMNLIEFAMRRPFAGLVLLVALASAASWVCGRCGQHRPCIYPHATHLKLPSISVPSTWARQADGSELRRACMSRRLHEQSEQAENEHQKIVLTSPHATDVTITQRYVCQIRSQRHIKIVCFEQRVSRGDPGQRGSAR